MIPFVGCFIQQLEWLILPLSVTKIPDLAYSSYLITVAWGTHLEVKGTRTAHTGYIQVQYYYIFINIYQQTYQGHLRALRYCLGFFLNVIFNWSQLVNIHNIMNMQSLNMSKFQTQTLSYNILQSQTVSLYRFLTIKLSSGMGVQDFYALPEIAFIPHFPCL